MFNHESTGATSSTLLGQESSNAVTEIDRASREMHPFRRLNSEYLHLSPRQARLNRLNRAPQGQRRFATKGIA